MPVPPHRKRQAKQLKLRVIKGGRATLERELLWLIVLGGDEVRREAPAHGGRESWADGGRRRWQLTFVGDADWQSAVLGEDCRRSVQDCLPPFDFGLSNDAGCRKQPLAISSANGRSTSKLDVRRARHGSRPPATRHARDDDERATASEGRELALPTQRRHTCRSKADAQISRNVQVEWTSRPPFAVIQISRERDIPATGKRTLSTLWSWCGSRNAFVRPGRWPARRPSWSGFRHLPRPPKAPATPAASLGLREVKGVKQVVRGSVSTS